MNRKNEFNFHQMVEEDDNAKAKNAQHWSILLLLALLADLSALPRSGGSKPRRQGTKIGKVLWVIVMECLFSSSTTQLIV
jgi:hypothetical protein